MRPDAKLGRPDAPMWSLQMRIIRIRGGGNETDSHSHRRRSPTRTTLRKFKNQYKRKRPAQSTTLIPQLKKIS